MTGRYTHATDVWSFGVVMMEVYIDGKLPYGRMDNQTVMQKVGIEGHRMLKPESCTEDVYGMLNLWSSSALCVASAREELRPRAHPKPHPKHTLPTTRSSRSAVLVECPLKISCAVCRHLVQNPVGGRIRLLHNVPRNRRPCLDVPRRRERLCRHWRF